MENLYDGVTGEVSFGPYYWPSAKLMKEYTLYLVSLDNAALLKVIPVIYLPGFEKNKIFLYKSKKSDLFDYNRIIVI